MRSRSITKLIFAIPTLLPAGCGTVVNLTAPPGEPGHYRAFGPNTCVPFGGLERAIMGGSAVCMGGPSGIPLFAAYVAFDGPLCLAADLLTYPVARARMRREPWACWWGEQDRSAGATSDPPARSRTIEEIVSEFTDPLPPPERP